MGSATAEAVSVVDIPVSFGASVSLGTDTARLRLKIDRSTISISKADKCFCGHRIQGEIRLGGQDDAAGQQLIADDIQHVVRGSFDVNGVNLKPDYYGIGLTFSIRDIDPDELKHFIKGKGRLIVNVVSEIPEKGEANGHEEEGEDAGES